MNIADALSGNAGVEGVQWMFSGAPHKALRSELSALLSSPDMLGPCCLRRARFKPGRRFTACYDAHIRLNGNGRHIIRPVAVSWKLNQKDDRHHVRTDLAALEVEAARRRISAPFRKLLAYKPALGMNIRVSPLDGTFPQLVRLCDPRYVRDMLAQACSAGGAAPRYVAASRYSVTFIRYRPGQRHVLRYDALNSLRREALFGKLYTGEEGTHAFRLAQLIGDWLAEHGEAAASVRPLAYMAEDAVILYPQVCGTPLSERLRHSGRGLSTPLKQAGAALYALHQVPSTIARQLQPHDFATEVKEISRTSQHIFALLPAVGSALKALLDRAQQLHERLPIEPPAFAYGDFKAAHLWTDPVRATLIDFDSCCLGDPALDIGKFLADLRFWCAVYDQQGLKQTQEHFLAGYGSSGPPERLIRARLYEVIELVKMTVRRVRMFEHDWAERTGSLVAIAEAALNDFQRSLGVMKRARESRA